MFTDNTNLKVTKYYKITNALKDYMHTEMLSSELSARLVDVKTKLEENKTLLINCTLRDVNTGELYKAISSLITSGEVEGDVKVIVLVWWTLPHSGSDIFGYTLHRSLEERRYSFVEDSSIVVNKSFMSAEWYPADRWTPISVNGSAPIAMQFRELGMTLIPCYHNYSSAQVFAGLTKEIIKRVDGQYTLKELVGVLEAKSRDAAEQALKSDILKVLDNRKDGFVVQAQKENRDYYQKLRELHDIENRLIYINKRESMLTEFKDKLVKDGASMQSLLSFFDVSGDGSGLYTGIQTDDENIFLTTKDIFLSGFWCGKYEITIKQNGAVLFKNINNQIFDAGIHCDHPHVNDKLPCFGNVLELVHKLTDSFDLVGLLGVLSSFLHSYNHKGPFAAIYYWPIVDCKEAVELIKRQKIDVKNIYTFWKRELDSNLHKAFKGAKYDTEERQRQALEEFNKAFEGSGQQSYQRIIEEVEYDDEEDADPDDVECQSCGRWNLWDAEICDECGEEL